MELSSMLSKNYLDLVPLLVVVGVLAFMSHSHNRKVDWKGLAIALAAGVVVYVALHLYGPL